MDQKKKKPNKEKYNQNLMILLFNSQQNNIQLWPNKHLWELQTYCTGKSSNNRMWLIINKTSTDKQLWPLHKLGLTKLEHSMLKDTLWSIPTQFNFLSCSITFQLNYKLQACRKRNECETLWDQTGTLCLWYTASQRLHSSKQRKRGLRTNLLWNGSSGRRLNLFS